MSAVCIIAPRECFAGEFIGLSLMEALVDLQHRARIDPRAAAPRRSISAASRRDIRRNYSRFAVCL
jgi:hypothetical protein